MIEDDSGGLFGRNDVTGFHVITPFKLENSEDRILVNRGWVPKNKINPQARGENVPKDVIDLNGVVRLSDGEQLRESGDRWSSR